MRALTFRAFKYANSSSKSFVTLSVCLQPVGAERVRHPHALVGFHARPELAIGLAFLFK